MFNIYNDSVNVEKEEKVKGVAHDTCNNPDLHDRNK